MSRMRQVSGREAVRAFEAAGFVVVRVTGSHHIMARANWPNRLSIPVHKGKNIPPPLLKAQIEAAGMTVEEFLSHL